MKLLSNFLLLVLVIIAVVAFLPLLSFGFAVVGGAAVLAIWILPLWIIATSDKTNGYEKIAWLLAMVCLSWFAWVFYFFLAPIKPRHQHYHY
jgi:O-antigen/teichoic acid export membrane protein